jgi:hypothetical protein
VSSRGVVGICALLVSACVDRQQGSSLSPVNPSVARETVKLQPAGPQGFQARTGLLDFPWLEAGRHAAEVMTLGGSPEMEAIATRFKAAARQNRAWFEEYTAKHAGETLPWHANMGITAEEYQAFLQSKGTLGMHKQIDTVLVIEEDGPDIALSTGGSWKFFDDLNARIRKDASQGSTALGPLPQKVRVVASPSQSVTGPWDGSCWRASELSGLCLGKTSSGRGILSYEARVEGDTRPQANSDFVVLFDL